MFLLLFHLSSLLTFAFFLTSLLLSSHHMFLLLTSRSPLPPFRVYLTAAAITVYIRGVAGAGIPGVFLRGSFLSGASGINWWRSLNEALHCRRPGLATALPTPCPSLPHSCLLLVSFLPLSLKSIPVSSFTHFFPVFHLPYLPPFPIRLTCSSPRSPPASS